MKFDPIEIAAIKELIFDEINGLIPDYKKAYLLINPDYSTKENINDLVSHWKNKPRVRKLYNSLKDSANSKIEQRFNLYASSENENETGSNDKNKLDYTKRLNIINFLNKQLNTIQDDKQKLDYIKTLIDLLRLKEDQNKNTNDIQRFYTVITCSNCELYKQKKAEINSNNNTL